MKERSRGKLMRNNIWKLTISLYLSLGLYSTSVHSSGGPVGSVNGSFSVTPGGVAAYSIPIKVPTGIGGIKPGVSLTYSSQAGNGLLGVGWNISGLSSITRCPQNLAQDTRIRGVKLDANDRFCLDGQRLVAINPNTTIYGQNNTEYRTEQDIFSKITSKGFLDNGPESFEVLTKDGLRMQFGDVAANASGQFNSRFAPHGKEAVHIWAISSITDNAGNSINFNYQFIGDEDVSTGTSSNTGYNREYYPDEITYSGDGKLSFNYGVAGSEARPDPIVGYRAGGKVQTTKRLEKITVEIANRLVRNYILAYKPADANSNRSKVATVTECGLDGQCLPATKIGWQASDQSGTTAWQSDTTYQLPAGLELSVNGEDKKGIRFIDLDGDGYQDIIYYRWIDSTSFESETYLNKNGEWVLSNAYSAPYPLIRDDGRPAGSRIIDVNGDGLVDFIWSRDADNAGNMEQGAYLNTGSGWLNDSSGQFIPPYALARHDGKDWVADLVDLNSDGLVDMVYRHEGTTSVTSGVNLGSPNGWGPHTLSYVPPINISNLDRKPSSTRWVDINGDGLIDLMSKNGIYLQQHNGGNRWETSPSSEYIFPVSPTTSVSNDGYTNWTWYLDDATRELVEGGRLIDLNGDGLLDIIRRYSNGDDPVNDAYLNTGNGWVSAEHYTSPVLIATMHSTLGDLTGHAVKFIDLNGDGLLDIFYHTHILHIYDKTTQEWIEYPDRKRAYLNTGSGWSRNDSYAPPYDLVLINSENAGTRLVDIDADGKPEILHSADGVTELAVNTRRETQVVESFTSGFGTKTNITYKPLTDSGVYTKGTTNCQYPTPCIISPMSVVSEHTVSNGIGGTARYTYQYSDARIHSLGRGWLGFASRAITDMQTGQTTTTTFDNITHFSSLLVDNSPSINVFPFLNMPKKVTLSHAYIRLGNLVDMVTSETVNHYAVKSGVGWSSSYSVYLQNSTSEEKNLDGTPLKYITSTTVMDDFGNAVNITVDTQQSRLDATFAYRQTTSNTYENDTVNWHLGRLTASSVTSYSGTDFQTRNTAYGYYPDGMLQWTEDEPTDPDLYLKTEYTYDAYGNKASVTVSGSSAASYPVATRTTTSHFDYTDHQYPVVTATVPVEGAITQSETKVFDARWGKLDQQTGPNGLTSRWTYDAFGRRSTETRPDDTTTTWSYGWCDGTDTSCPAYAVYKITTTRSDGAISTAYMDEFSRQLRVKTLGLDGVVVHQDTQYDEAGRLLRSSRPYFKGATTQYWTTNTFDILNRIKTRINPDGSIVTNDYEGLQTTVSTERRTGGEYTSLSVREIKNLAGKVEWVFDAHNKGTRYTYLPFGELDTVTDPMGNVILMEYDNRGRKTKLIDPDMGSWQYATDALGNLRWQQDAKGQETTMNYDLLNRMRTRVDVRNLADPASVEKTSQWDYFTEADTANSCRSIGKLKSSSDGATTKNFCYDHLGRITSATSNFDGSSYSVATAYDVYSRVDTIAYPAQDGANPAFIKRNVYDAYGHLKAVQDGASNDALWTAELVNASGNITTETLGNGLTTFRTYDTEMGFLTSISTGAGTSSGVQSLAFEFDSLGTLVSRTDHNRIITQPNGTTQNGSIESFTYDALNRVSTVLRDGQQTTQYQYDALGNITFNSELGTYQYNSTRPHAVTDISRSNTGALAGDISGDGRINGLDAALLARSLVGLSTLSESQALAADCNAANGVTLDDTVCIAAHAGSTSSTIDETLTYDANGNMETGIGGKVITYTAFNKPETITRGANSTRFAYDIGRARYLQVATDASGTTKTHYLGQLFERIQKPNGIIEYKNYIYAGNRMIAVNTRRSNNTTELNYLHRDHINSTTAITDANGIVKERLSYDVFGKRRNDASWKAASTLESIVSSTSISSVTRRGYTEHEFLQGVGLIHMNGRVFDPELGRFLSADPFVQFKQNQQSFNRYSYVLNNPLSFTDPSGYFSVGGFFDDIGDAVRDAGDDLGQGLRDFVDDVGDFLDENGRTIVAIGIVAIPGMNLYAAGFLSSLISSGGDFKAAVIGGITAGMFAGVGNAALQGSWGASSRVLAHGMVGGAASLARGGSFKAGFLSSAVMQTANINGAFAKGGNPVVNVMKSAIVGGTVSVVSGGKFANGAKTFAFVRMVGELNDYAGRETDRLKRLACSSGGARCRTDSRGVLRTDGTRDVTNPNQPGNWLTESGMAAEGSGEHWYDPGGPLESQSLSHYVTDVSKVHDWFNSFNYTSSTGFYMNQGVMLDSAFQVYSMAGMPVAAVMTNIGYAASSPSAQRILIGDMN